MRDFSYLPPHKRAGFHRLSISAVLITGCLLLLSSCNSMRGTANNVNSAFVHRAVLAANVDESLRAPGLAQLETLQPWVALMQQYNCDVRPYHQVLSRAQQSLRVGPTERAYHALLHT